MTEEKGEVFAYRITLVVKDHVAMFPEGDVHRLQLLDDRISLLQMLLADFANFFQILAQSIHF